MCPEEAIPRAQMQLLARYADTYLSPGGLFPLFQRVGKPGDAEQELAGLDAELARLQRLLDFLPDFRQRFTSARSALISGRSSSCSS